jgi:hypothetical protein
LSKKRWGEPAFFSTTLYAEIPLTEHYNRKRYVGVVKNRCGIETFFSTTPYAENPLFGIVLWKTV